MTEFLKEWLFGLTHDMRAFLAFLLVATFCGAMLTIVITICHRFF